MTTRQEAINGGSLFLYLSERVHSSWAMVAHKADEIRQRVKKVSTKPTAQKACADRTGAACVLYIIRKSEKGVHPTTLAQMTGYKKPKLDKLLHKLFKHGEIMIEPGGVYTSTKEYTPFATIRES